MARYYVLSIQAPLFGKSALLRKWGRIGCAGRPLHEIFTDDTTAEVALNVWLERRRKRGYTIRR
jgi:predicted DNA-binding WGR domain protein